MFKNIAHIFKKNTATTQNPLLGMEVTHYYEKNHTSNITNSTTISEIIEGDGTITEVKENGNLIVTTDDNQTSEYARTDNPDTYYARVNPTVDRYNEMVLVY